MARIKLTVSYDGTNYCGWQKQNNGTSVESVLNEALSQLFCEEINVIGASRTDSGVHALGNVAVFDTTSRIPADKVSYALNTRLPEDIRIQKSELVLNDFHPRHCECVKTYEYHILNKQMPIPLFTRYADFQYYSLDIEKMKEAAKYIVGEHDFNCFCSSGSQVKDTVRTIYLVNIYKDSDDIITIRIRGNGFLYNMVRIIAGTLIEVGRGAINPEHMYEIIESRNRKNAGPTASAKGLTLVDIEYPE